jgi:hypothetical protein
LSRSKEGFFIKFGESIILTGVYKTLVDTSLTIAYECPFGGTFKFLEVSLIFFVVLKKVYPCVLLGKMKM